jgi:hypothetical protein
MAAEAPDRARPVRLILVIGAVVAALAAGFLVRVLMSERRT